MDNFDYHYNSFNLKMDNTAYGHLLHVCSANLYNINITTINPVNYIGTYYENNLKTMAYY